MLIAEGHVQREGDIVHVVVTKMRAIDGELAGLEVSSRNFH